MRITCPILVGAFLIAGASLPAGQQPVPAPPTPPQGPFRTGVDLVNIDVSVLDQNYQPVRGLTAEDFSIRENGKPQRIVAFVPMEVPVPAPVSAPWMRDIGPDVVTNALDTRRLVVILMDDGNTSFAQGESKLARGVARAIIDGLGPADLAAVVFTFLGRAQNFTADRQQLYAAVDSFTPRNSTEGPRVGGFGEATAAGKPLGCILKLGGCTVDALKNVAMFLETAPPGRKLVFYVGSDPGLSVGGDPNNQIVAVMDMFRALHRQTFRSTHSMRRGSRRLPQSRAIAPGRRRARARRLPGRTRTTCGSLRRTPADAPSPTPTFRRRRYRRSFARTACTT